MLHMKLNKNSLYIPKRYQFISIEHLALVILKEVCGFLCTYLLKYSTRGKKIVFLCSALNVSIESLILDPIRAEAAETISEMEGQKTSRSPEGGLMTKDAPMEEHVQGINPEEDATTRSWKNPEPECSPDLSGEY